LYRELAGPPPWAVVHTPRHPSSPTPVLLSPAGAHGVVLSVDSPFFSAGAKSADGICLSPRIFGLSTVGGLCPPRKISRPHPGPVFSLGARVSPKRITGFFLIVLSRLQEAPTGHNKVWRGVSPRNSPSYESGLPIILILPPFACCFSLSSGLDSVIPCSCERIRQSWDFVPSLSEVSGPPLWKIFPLHEDPLSGLSYSIEKHCPTKGSPCLEFSTPSRFDFLQCSSV